MCLQVFLVRDVRNQEYERTEAHVIMTCYATEAEVKGE